MTAQVPDTNTLESIAKVTSPSQTLGAMQLRLAYIVDRDSATKTCSIVFSEEDAVDDTKWIDDQKVLPATVPVVNQWAWVWQNRSDYVIAAMADAELPKARMRSFETQIISSDGVPQLFDFSGGIASFDTDYDGTASMLDQSNSRLYFRWPGKYQFGAHVTHNDVATRWVLDVKLNGTDFLGARVDHRDGASLAGSMSGSDIRTFNAGDYIQLFVTSAGGTATFGSVTDEIGCNLWAAFAP